MKMKVHIEIEDDSKFLEALADQLKPSKPTEGDDSNEDNLLDRNDTEAFSCVAISCNT